MASFKHKQHEKTSRELSLFSFLDGGIAVYNYDVFLREKGGQWTKANKDIVFSNFFWVNDLLKPGYSYDFKVEATNEAGLTSSSGAVSESITTPKSFDIPSGDLPAPEVRVTSLDSAAVTWQPPSEYQSKKISYSVLYKSEGNAVWSEIQTKKNQVQIDDLKEGVSYVFKVVPKNEAGIGKESPQTEPTVISGNLERFKVCIRFLAYQRPTITKPIRSVTVPKKKELRLDCHALGEPTPQYTWMKDGQELVPQDDNVSVSNEGFMSVLTIHEVGANDAGCYECRVSNVHGVEKSRADVTVGDVRAHFLTSFAEHTHLVEHATLELECELSDEEAVVQWLKV